MAKTQRETATLFSSSGTGFFYANRKNKKKLKGEKKMALRKYDPIARQHVLFEEKKASKLKKKFKSAAVAKAGATESGKKESATAA